MTVRDRWHEVDDVFRRVLDLPASERGAFVDRSCRDDRELRLTIEELLEATAKTDSFLDTPVEDLCEIPWQEVFPGPALAGNVHAVPGAGAAPDRSGEPVGPYRLVRRIGRGGMASVYLAERVDGQFEQQVAVKLLRRGTDTDDIVRRFLTERQILSSLAHPNIARLLDGGATDDGLPYLVMEYVEGTPIVAYCDERRLPIRERLRLFCDVARAVQHAHRSLVVHRDLKPSNILVDADDRVKLLDFGIARLLTSSAEAEATRTGLRALTPAYASPEQVRGELITTASDVYQLGLLLCQLMAGRLPYEVRALSPARAEREITESTPARPSSCLTREAAAARSATREELARRLRGDLDTIVLHALRKEPEARYTSAEAFIRDIERHLAGLPIAARPASLLYRARKLLGRQPWIVPAAATALLAVGAYVFTMERHASQLEDERNLARAEASRSGQMADFLSDLFLAANPTDEASIRNAGDLVDFGVARADSALADNPEIHLKVLTTLGRSAYWLGQLETARALLERSVELEEEVRVDLDPMTGWWANQYLGAARYALGDYEAAEATYRRTLELYRPLLGARSEPIGRTLSVLGWLYHETGELERAERSYREALAIQREASGPESPTYATALENLGLLLADQGNPEAGEALVRQAIAIRRETLGPRHPNIAFGLRSLGRVLYRQGEVETAEQLLREALPMRRDVLGPTHHKFAEDVAALGSLLVGRGELAEGRQLLAQALEIRRESLGDEHPVTAVTKHHLATVFHRMGERGRAEGLYREAAAALSRGFGAGHGWTIAVSEDLDRLRDGREPAEREWLSGTRLPLPAASRVEPAFASNP
jgi:serine/threonine-protein kinase